jgi:hypothetical protein
VLIAAGAIAFVYLPFGLRDLVVTGDPFYPAGVGLLRGSVPGVSKERYDWATRFSEHVAGPLGVAWGPSLASGRVDEVVGWHHLAGLLALGLAARKRELRLLAAPVTAYLALSLVFRPPARYLFPAWLSLAALEGIAVAAFWPRRARFFALAALPAAVASAGLLFGQFGPFAYLLGRESRGAFLRRVLPGFAAAGFVNTLPPGGRVMALDFPGPVYFDRPFLDEGVHSEPPLKGWLREEPSADALLARLRKHDVRYLVVTPGYGGGTRLSLLRVADRPQDAGPLYELRSRLRLAATLDGVDVYAVPAEGE